VARCDKPAHDWTCDGTNKCCTTKDGDGDSSIHRTPEICQRTSDDRKRRTTEKATEEATDEYCFQILSDGDGDLEDGEDEIAGKERDLATVEF